MPLYPHTLMHGGSGSASGGCEGDSTGGSDSGASGHGDEGRGAGSREGRRVGGRGAGGHDGAATTGRANSAGRHSRLPACRFGLAGRMRGVEEKCALPSNCAGWAVTVESAESTGVRCAWTSSAFTDRQASRKKASLPAGSITPRNVRAIPSCSSFRLQALHFGPLLAASSRLFLHRQSQATSGV